MTSYFDEHRVNENIADDALTLARLIVEGGWTSELGLSYEMLFPNSSKGASKKAIEELERIKAADVERGECLICLGCFAEDKDEEELIRMPCSHLFHSKCILKWLERSNSCPACRHELPSHDPLYEEYKRQEKRKAERQADLDELHDSMFS